MKTAVFIGHNECYGLSVDMLKSAIRKCINNGVEIFLSGGQGGFDRISSSTVFKLKKDYPNIKNILVIPYLSFNIFNKDLFDEIVFPDDFEKYSYKAAIPKRNKYMVDNSSVAICYVEHSWGNAAKTYDYAKRSPLHKFLHFVQKLNNATVGNGSKPFRPNLHKTKIYFVLKNAG